MEKMYKLSVIVLVYNTEQYLRECFDSLVNQTLDGIEIIIVNDSSPDNSHIIIEEYCNKYENIKVINQENSGGAIAGNNGLNIASGEYVTIMDSDDVVPIDAYEKLYKKAKETDSEIVIGKPNILIDGIQKEILYKKEREVWQQNRVIENLHEFLDVFYDGFYWNKIFKKDLIFKYNCFMPPGMLYADRPMVHKSFLHAKRIAIITDVVYLWRKRGNNVAQKSITQMNSDINNFKDRMESCNYQINYFDDFGDKKLTNEFLKRNIDRFFFPISGIVESEEFRDIYFNEVGAILSRISDVYNNDLGVKKNIYIYMILNNLKVELKYYLTTNLNGKIIGEKGKYYWALPYFRNKSLNIPDYLFQIKDLLEDFIKIDSFYINNNVINFEKIRIPLSLKVDQAKLVVQSRFNINDYKTYELNHQGYNNFDVTVALDNYDLVNLYDVYIVFEYNNKEVKYRISRKMFTNQELEDFSDSDKAYIHFTENDKLSLRVTNFKVLNFDADQFGMSLNSNNALNDSLQFYLRDRRTKESIFLQRNELNNYYIRWEHFLEKYTTYDLYFDMFDQKHRLDTHTVLNFKPLVLKIDGYYIELYVTKKGNISMKTYTSISKISSRIKKILKK
ncbi:glycosyltransferase [Bacillus wiedmannii]|nr:glycosyltransferase [Bacillus wiedmannii]PEM33277.1 glycosyltransferase [Bacillus wiedmannii]PEP24273.1 glycosyltransferase [Bacillus wiedmannii]PFX62805.1 glycosyltransferase [Bacillus wiedmannii]PFZ46644.1 glycosyltransferase [Bacillus wiedmannii]